MHTLDELTTALNKHYNLKHDITGDGLFKIGNEYFIFTSNAEGFEVTEKAISDNQSHWLIVETPVLHNTMCKYYDALKTGGQFHS